MRHTFIFIFLFVVGCNKTPSTPPSDANFITYGIVIEGRTNVTVDSVLIGFKNPHIADTNVFIGDSVILVGTNGEKYAGMFLGPTNEFYVGEPFFTGDTNVFNLGGAFIAGPPGYQNMFAYRRGFRLWRFNPSIDPVVRVAAEADSLTIRMQRKP